MTGRSIAAALLDYTPGDVVLLGYAVIRLRRTKTAIVHAPRRVLECAPVSAPPAGIARVIARATPWRLRTIVDHASWIAGGTCLTRSLVLQSMLRAAGVAATVTIGARRSRGTIEAHAWIEPGEVLANDATAPAPFVTLYRVMDVSAGRG